MSARALGASAAFADAPVCGRGLSGGPGRYCGVNPDSSGGPMTLSHLLAWIGRIDHGEEVEGKG